MRSYRIQFLFLVLIVSVILFAQAKPISAGTEIKVRMIDSLSSGTAKVGDLFHATLEQPVMQDGKQLYPKGADVTGTVAAVHASGRLTDPGSLSLVLNTITSGHSAASISVRRKLAAVRRSARCLAGYLEAAKAPLSVRARVVRLERAPPQRPAAKRRRLNLRPC